MPVRAQSQWMIDNNKIFLGGYEHWYQTYEEPHACNYTLYKFKYA